MDMAEIQNAMPNAARMQYAGYNEKISERVMKRERRIE
jgi:hypothetical protein